MVREADAAAPAVPVGQGSLPHFRRPYDWPLVDATVRARGGAVVEGLVGVSTRADFDDALDAWLARHAGAGRADSGSGLYDSFLGRRTLRLHGLAAKLPDAADVLAHPAVTAWARRMLAPVCSGIQLNAGELIEIGPGEPAQLLHRDTDSWPDLPPMADTVLVNAIVALSPFTAETGATQVVLDSHTWERGRWPTSEETVQATMQPGDALLFRGDVVHGGGANTSDGTRRRGLSLSYVVGWLRPVENSSLNVPAHRAGQLSRDVQALLGYEAHDATGRGGGLLGLFDNGDPRHALDAGRPRI